MMKRNLLIAFLAVSMQLHGQDAMEKEKLHKLIEERKEKFDSYFQSLEKRSGIFGNKTRQDILSSNKVLIDIVRTDNNIISVLNRALDYKSFEKTTYSYDKVEQEATLNNLRQANETLNRRIKSIHDSHQALERRYRNSRVINIILMIIVAYAAVRTVIRKRNRRAVE
jgi:hypothetical protein